MTDGYTFPVGDYPRPGMVRVQELQEIAQYTDPSQFEFFRDWINWNNNNNCNVRFDPDDPSGTTIRWYWAYYLRLGEWLLGGLYPVSEEKLRYLLAPQSRWPDNLTERELAPYYRVGPYPPAEAEPEPAPDPAPEPEPEPDGGTEVGTDTSNARGE